MQKTSAWPLALLYSALIVYASLYPFGEWRDQGIAPWAFLTASLPKYWTWFDVIANVLGYAPVGFLLVIAALRSTSGQRTSQPVFAFVVMAMLACALLSLCMETLQSYLPSRVPSNVDFALNTAGGFAGACIAGLLEPLGAIDRWARFRSKWFVQESRGALVLIALWPVALLFPAPVPFGLGQVFERVENFLAEVLQDTPFLDWLPVREFDLQPLVPSAEMLCVMLGALAPCLLAFSVMNGWFKRLIAGLFLITVGIATTVLSSALSFGPAHSWAWLGDPSTAGIVLACVAIFILLPFPRRGCAAIALVCIAFFLSILNQAPTSAYFAQTLQTWEQGRFIRFHGIVQWLGWLWPYLTLLYLLAMVSVSQRKN